MLPSNVRRTERILRTLGYRLTCRQTLRSRRLRGHGHVGMHAASFPDNRSPLWRRARLSARRQPILAGGSRHGRPLQHHAGIRTHDWRSPRVRGRLPCTCVSASATKLPWIRPWVRRSRSQAAFLCAIRQAKLDRRVDGSRFSTIFRVTALGDGSVVHRPVTCGFLDMKKGNSSC
jgi:hypothetical protein